MIVVVLRYKTVNCRPPVSRCGNPAASPPLKSPPGRGLEEGRIYKGAGGGGYDPPERETI
ncbi:hypothetical protein A5CPYCFAH4_08300 [Alistipes onderdonkii subsp. vulgaris]|uniref:Uncharacterized protein n=1 Tax=Alistipes onderdonkii subsp. vulgaris TaxID=2585117 RepID=A0ACA8QUZ4_9BACT|nr:hypothetical protein A5CPYCFAH4_08300 [Alistipes onderdonkii subsp. vulgaris]BBL11398.1 hypothetical protein A5NYCFA2_08310 [Alistipes onderdonkii subsp. vulgaris]